MVDLPANNELPVVNDMDENAVLQMLEELGGNDLPAVNDMDENAIFQMIWGMPFWKVMQILEGKLELLNLRIPPLFVTL